MFIRFKNDCKPLCMLVEAFLSLSLKPSLWMFIRLSPAERFPATISLIPSFFFRGRHLPSSCYYCLKGFPLAFSKLKILPQNTLSFFRALLTSPLVSCATHTLSLSLSLLHNTSTHLQIHTQTHSHTHTSTHTYNRTNIQAPKAAPFECFTYHGT